MRRFLPLILLFALAGPAHAARVQGNVSPYSSRSSMPCAFMSDNTAGNLIVVLGSGMNNNTIAISDTQGNMYHQLVLDGFFATTNMFGAWYAEGIKAGPNTVTISWVTAETAAIGCEEYDHVAVASSLDQSGYNTGTGPSYTSLVKTTTANHETIVSFTAAALSISTTTGGFTAAQTLQSGGMTYSQIADQIDQPIGSYTATGACVNGKWAVYLATFKAGSGTTQIGGFLAGP